MNELVSIVLPTYNGSKFIKESIDSCLNQTYKNIELIIVNDCSTDNTEELIQSYHDERIVYVKNDQNQKLPKSLNIGFSKANGTYLTWTSDDNFYVNNAIEKMVTHLENKKVDLVYAPYKTINETGKVDGFREVGEIKHILKDNIVKACFLYTKEIQHTLKGYGTDLFLVEDYDFWIRAAYNNFKFGKLEEELYYYRFHDASLTETRRKEISAALYKLLSHHVENFENAKKKDFLNGGVYLKLAKLSNVNGENIETRKYLWESFEKQPSIFFSLAFIKTFIKTFNSYK